MNEQSAPDSGAATKKAAVRVQRADGSWEELTPKPLSDDPVVNAIGDLDPEQMRALLANEEHPDHPAAVEYDRLLRVRMRTAVNAAVNGAHLAPGAIAALETFQKNMAATLQGVDLMPNVVAMLDTYAKTSAAALQGAQLTPNVVAALDRFAQTAATARKSAQLPPDVAASLKSFSTIHADLVKRAGPTFQAPKTSAELIDGTPAADVAELLDIRPPSSRGATYDLVHGQEQTNELLQQAVEVMGSFTGQQGQLLDIERAKTTAAEEREKVAKKEADRSKHLAWWSLIVGAVVGVAGVVATFVA